MQIRRAEEKFRTVQRHVALCAWARAFGEPARVMPELIPRHRIESLNIVVVTMNEDHAVMDERRCLIWPGRQADGPCDTKIFHIVFRDLLQRTETEVIVRTTPCEPLTGRRIA